VLSDKIIIVAAIRGSSLDVSVSMAASGSLPTKSYLATLLIALKVQ